MAENIPSFEDTTEYVPMEGEKIPTWDETSPVIINEGQGSGDRIPWSEVPSAMGEAGIDAFVGMGRGFNPYADEAGAAIMSMIDGGLSYKEAKKIYDEDWERRKKRSPVASTAGEFAGAAVLPAPGLSTAHFAKDAGKIAKFIGKSAAMTKNMLVHGAFGAAYAAGEGDTIEERIQNALWGGRFGAGGAAIAGPLMTVAERYALKSITKNELAIDKMAAYVPGGKKKLGEYLLRESLTTPLIKGPRGVLRKIETVFPRLEEQYKGYLKMADSHGARFNMADVVKEMTEKVINPLKAGDSITERALADAIKKEFPGFLENPIRTLTEANNARKKMDDVLASVYSRMKSARVAGESPELSDKKFAEVRSIFTGLLDDRIEEAMTKVAGDGAHGRWREVKTSYQMLIEARQAAIQKLGGRGVGAREAILAMAMPFNIYTGLYGASVIVERGSQGRISGIAARTAYRAGKTASKPGPIGTRVRETIKDIAGDMSQREGNVQYD